MTPQPKYFSKTVDVKPVVIHTQMKKERIASKRNVTMPLISFYHLVSAKLVLNTPIQNQMRNLVSSVQLMTATELKSCLKMEDANNVQIIQGQTPIKKLA